MHLTLDLSTYIRLFLLFILLISLSTFSKAQVVYKVRPDSVFITNSGKTLFSVDAVGRVKIDSAGSGASDNFILTWDPATKKIDKIAKAEVIAPEGPVVLSKGTVSNVSALDIDLSQWYASYDIIEIRLIGMRPTDDGAKIWMLMSADGTNYDNGENNYHWGYLYNIDGNAGSVGSNGDDKIQIAGGGSYLPSAGTSGIITLHNTGSSSSSPLVSMQLSKISDDGGEYGNMSSVTGSAMRRNPQVTKAVRLYYSYGDIAAAKYKIIGYKN